MAERSAIQIMKDTAADPNTPPEIRDAAASMAKALERAGVENPSDALMFFLAALADATAARDQLIDTIRQSNVKQ